MDIYVVLDEGSLVGAAAAPQGAELIRADHAAEAAGQYIEPAFYDDMYRLVYDRQQIINTELQDAE